MQLQKTVLKRQCDIKKELMANINETHKENTTAEEHVELLINNVQCLIDSKLDFHAFIVLSIGIEFLGAFTDSEDFNDFGLSKSRFENSLEHWFTNKWYKEKKAWVFENLRGPLVHQYRAGKEILLTSKCKNDVDLSKHLTVSDGKIIFVLEQLFDDFKKAHEKRKREFDKENNPYKGTKAKEGYQTIYEIDKWSGEQLILSGQTCTYR
jgi:hypothetical protein